MKPVYQTVFGTPNGNCLQACVASILELSLDSVPNFAGHGRDGFHKLLLWLDDRQLRLGECNVRALANWPRGPVIVSGASPRFPAPWKHAVVVEQGTIVHDPHPAGGGILTAEVVWRLVPWPMA